MKTGIHLRIRHSNGVDTVSLGYPENYISECFEVAPDALKDALAVREVRIAQETITFIADIPTRGFVEVKYSPHKFPEYIEWLYSTNKNVPSLDSLTQEQIGDALLVYLRWLEETHAKEIIEGIAKGDVCFEDIREISTEIFQQPLLAKYLASRFATGDMPTRKAGKRATYNEKEHDLYAVACHIYRSSEYSFEAACHEAVTRYPELVPSTWTEPADTLKRRASQYWDKSRHSLKDTRKKLRDRY